jgi:hypothetical protein
MPPTCVPAQLQPIAKPDATHAETPVVLPDGTAYLASSTSGQLLRSSVHQPDRCTAASAAAARRRLPPLQSPAGGWAAHRGQEANCWHQSCSCRLEHIAWLAGQPLGMAMHPDGYLVICDAAKVHPCQLAAREGCTIHPPHTMAARLQQH